MKKIIVILIALIVCLGTAAEADETAILGKPFPDFTVTDTQGNVFTLSEALKIHEAVLLNLWATWCPPCRMEFPDMNEAYEQYGDRVPFIALSTEVNDTNEKIEEFRTEMGLAFPMGRDEGNALSNYINSMGIPTTVMIDRFGNAAFVRVGSFNNAGEIGRVIEAFLGDGYTETKVLNEIPRESATAAFPVSKSRAIHIENEGAKQILFHLEGYPQDQTAYVIPDDTAFISLEIAASDNPGDIVYYDYTRGKLCGIGTLLDPERRVYTYEQEMPGEQDEVHYTYGALADASTAEDPGLLDVYLIAGEDYIEECADMFRSYGFEVSWNYTEPVQEEIQPQQAYVLHITDQDGTPVPEVFVNFCTDTACTMLGSDAEGRISFYGAQDDYHVQLLKVPEGYSFDTDYEMYTGRDYGEWVLRIRKN